jgi:hypothetical protein
MLDAVVGPRVERRQQIVILRDGVREGIVNITALIAGHHEQVTDSPALEQIAKHRIRVVGSEPGPCQVVGDDLTAVGRPVCPFEQIRIEGGQHA